MINSVLYLFAGRKTGEVLGVIDRGKSGLSLLLNYLLFNIVPGFVDIVVAIVYFAVAFNIKFGLIVSTCLVTYIVATVLISNWLIQFRRQMNNLDNQSRTMVCISTRNPNYYYQQQPRVLVKIKIFVDFL